MRTRDFDATLMCGITESAQGMGHSRSHWIQKEDPILKFSHFQTPLNSNCALEPNVPSLWYVTVIEYLSCLRKGNSKRSYSPSLRRTNLTSYLVWH